jgi:signal transduction histidine kinase/CheY-like chemotaxis protein
MYIYKTDLFRKTFLIFALILPLFSFLSCGKSGVNFYDKQPDRVPYSSFREIPGVTEDEIKAIEALQKEYDSFVYGMTLTTETFVDSINGEIKGYAALFCEWLTALFGITFEPSLYNWGDLFAGLASREIDFTGDLMATEERRQVFFMTDPVAERSLKYFQIAGQPNIYEIARSRPPRLIFLNASAVLDPVSEAVDYDFDVVFVEDFIAAYHLMKHGEADALMVMGIVEASFDEFGDVTAETFLPQVFNSASMSTQNPKLQPVISIVNKSLQDYNTRRFLSRLHSDGYHEYYRNKLITQFTDEEREYLQNRHVVPVAVDPGEYPGGFYDRREKEWKGIFFFFLNEITLLTGLEFERVNDEYATWPVIYQMLLDGEALIVPELIQTKERENLFLWPDSSQMTDYYALISKSDYPNIQIEDIIHYKIGLTKNTSNTAIFKRWFPNQPGTVEYQSIEDAFDALHRGEIDMVMASQIRLLYLTHYMEFPDYKANLVFEQPVDIKFGINRNELVLYSIIDKALKMIDTKGITNQWMRKTYDYRVKVADAQRPWFIGSSVLFLSALAIVTVLFVKNRRAGRQLKLQSEAALAAARAKGTFLAHMSHEIRTPLNAIIGMSYIVKDCVEDNKKALRSVNQIATSSHHLLGILNDILDMSKIESGKLELTREPFSLLAACGEVADIMKHRCVEKNIAFVTNIPEIKDITIIGDKLRLNQVLINLLGNAVKFTSENGEIKFITEILEESEDKAQVKFSVADTGIGMSEEQMKKLFIPFEQADTTIAARFGGTGLGLSLSQNFVTMMGGKIGVTSELNNGSTFDFSLWFNKSELSSSQALNEKEKYENVNLSGKRILLVEDIEINRLIVCELLSSANPTIDEAENGRQAVDAFSGSPEGYYDIILMDIQMPVLDGYEAAKEIRALNRADAKTVPIIAMTAHAYKEDVEQALAVGMNGHLAKPIDKPALMETVEKILKG